VTKRRARIYDGLALLVAMLVVVFDQWTKAWVVQNLAPPEYGRQISIIGQYLILYYIRNNGAAFSLFANSAVLIVLILAAIALVIYLYARMINNGTLPYKLIFGMIIGGALGNLIDRVRHSGYVVDFISFRIPQIGFYFAIFNIADAAISVGVVLLFLLLLFGGLRHTQRASTPTPPGDTDKVGSNAIESGESRKGTGQQESTPRL
jgi:signal peptidase II